MKIDYLSELSDLINQIKTDLALSDFVDNAISTMFESFSGGNKIMVAGNGGSAADASHFAAEFVGRYKIERQGFPFLCLSSDPSFLTAWSNDYDFFSIFSRQVETFGKEGDILFLISTSGNSKNLVEAAKAARSRGIKVVSLLGKSGGELKDFSDIFYIVPSDNTPRIQEIHIHIIHTICEILEKKLTQNN